MEKREKKEERNEETKTKHNLPKAIKQNLTIFSVYLDFFKRERNPERRRVNPQKDYIY